MYGLPLFVLTKRIDDGQLQRLKNVRRLDIK